MRLRGVELVFACVLSLAGVFGEARAHAQDDTGGDVDTGRSHFKSGVDYYRDGDLSAAMIEFKRAYSAAPNYRLLYNLGQVSQELLDYTGAQSYFQRYLDEGGSAIEPARRQEVETALAKIAARIASVVISANVSGAEVFVDDVSVGTTPFAEPVKVSAGTRRISATVSGRPNITQVVEAAGGETLVVTLEFPPASDNIAAGTQVQVKEWSPSPALWLGIGSGALAVGAGVMAYLTYSDASDYRDAIKRKTTTQEVQSLHDRATTKALVTDILLGATLVSTAITVYVALDDDGEEKAPSESGAQAHFTLGAGAVGLSGQF